MARRKKIIDDGPNLFDVLEELNAEAEAAEQQAEDAAVEAAPAEEAVDEVPQVVIRRHAIIPTRGGLFTQELDDNGQPIGPVEPVSESATQEPEQEQREQAAEQRSDDRPAKAYRKSPVPENPEPGELAWVQPKKDVYDFYVFDPYGLGQEGWVDVENLPGSMSAPLTLRTGAALDRRIALMEMLATARRVQAGRGQKSLDELVSQYRDYVFEYGPIHKQSTPPSERNGYSAFWEDNLPRAREIANNIIEDADARTINRESEKIAKGMARAVRATRDLGVFNRSARTVFALIEDFDFNASLYRPGRLLDPDVEPRAVVMSEPEQTITPQPEKAAPQETESTRSQDASASSATDASSPSASDTTTPTPQETSPATNADPAQNSGSVMETKRTEINVSADGEKLEQFEIDADGNRVDTPADDESPSKVQVSADSAAPTEEDAGELDIPGFDIDGVWLDAGEMEHWEASATTAVSGVNERTYQTDYLDIVIREDYTDEGEVELYVQLRDEWFDDHPEFERDFYEATSTDEADHDLLDTWLDHENWREFLTDRLTVVEETIRLQREEGLSFEQATIQAQQQLAADAAGATNTPSGQDATAPSPTDTESPAQQTTTAASGQGVSALTQQGAAVPDSAVTQPPSETAASNAVAAAEDDLPDMEQVLRSIAANAPQRAGEPVRFERGELMPPSGPKARARANMEAIRLLHALNEEGRWATREEQQVLAKYSAWGKCAEIFNEANPKWVKERNELRELVGDEDLYAELKATVLTAYYTPAEVTTAMWDVLKAAGYDNADGIQRVLEPGSGIGGLMEHAPATTRMVGVELDPIAASISSYLYPNATVVNAGFQDVDEPQASFHAAVGNVPYADVSPYDPVDNRQNFRLHDYFLTKSAQLVAPGGYQVMLTSTGTADKLDDRVRQALAEDMDVISAVRLPEGTFSAEAGTQAAADLLVLRKRRAGEQPLESTKAFLSSRAVHIDGVRHHVNSYFLDNSDHILGHVSNDSGPFGTRLVVRAMGDTPIGQRIVDVVSRDIRNLGDRAHYAPEVVEVDEPSKVHLRSARQAIEGELRYERAGSNTTFYVMGRRDWEVAKVAKNRAAETIALIDLRETALQLREAYSDANGLDTEDVVELRGLLNQQYDDYAQTYGPINRFTYAPPRVPSKARQEVRYQDLLTQWQQENQFSADTLPDEDTEAELRQMAAEKEAVDTKVQPHLQPFKADPMLAALISLEDFDELTQTAAKSAVFVKDPARREMELTHTDNLRDAASAVRARTGGLDIGAISELMDISLEEVEHRLVEEKVAYRDPENPDSFIPAVMYTSGMVRDKLRQARVAAEKDSRFEANVEALREVQPKRIEEGINVSIGVGWLPTTYYQDYLVDRVGGTRRHWDIVSYDGRLKMEQDTVSTFYERYRRPLGFDSAFGVVIRPNDTPNFSNELPGAKECANQGLACERPKYGIVKGGVAIFEDMLMGKSSRINNSKQFTELTGKAKLNADATLMAAKQARRIQEDFEKWLWDDPERRREVIDLYNQLHNNYRAPEFDGSARELPGLGEQFTPYAYQRNAVERIVNQPTVLLNHVVGAGKTGTMFMGAMELKRLGAIKQPWIVVPNHLVEQVTREASQWYPGAKVLSSTGVSSAQQKRRFLGQTMATEWDMVIVSQSVFDDVQASKAYREEYVDQSLNRMYNDIAGLNKTGGTSIKSVKALERQLKQRTERLSKLVKEDKPDTIPFEALNVDYLMVDEAHMYKNLERFSENPEIAHPGSQRAAGLDMKLGILRDKAEKAGLDPAKTPIATFATGTPIANNYAEMWVLAHYLRPEQLEKAGLESVGFYSSQYLRNEEVVEIRPTGTGLMSKTRTTGYVNMPELVRLNSSFMDTVTTKDLDLKLPQVGEDGKSTIVTFTPEQTVVDAMLDLSMRVAFMEGTHGEEDIDNTLKAMSDGQKITMHPKLAGIRVSEQSRRVIEVANQVERVWTENKDKEYPKQVGEGMHPNKGALQVVFCDTGTPKKDGSFSMYKAMKDEFVSRGMDPNRIAFVHDWDHDRAGLWRRCNDGELDVLIGSTQKMGTGANIQRRLIALHHVDVPWRPADLEQREGRIKRQGNLNDRVEIFNYVASNTLDSVRWQQLERKQLGVQQLLEGTLEARHVDAEVEDVAGQYAQMKAFATGDPRYITAEELRRKVGELQAEYTQHEALKKQQVENYRFDQRRMERLEGEIADIEGFRHALGVDADRKELLDSIDVRFASNDFQGTSPATTLVKALYNRQGNAFTLGTQVFNVEYVRDLGGMLGNYGMRITPQGFAKVPPLEIGLADVEAAVDSVRASEADQLMDAQRKPDAPLRATPAARGLLARLDNWLGAQETRVTSRKLEVADIQDRLDTYSVAPDEEFPKLAELEQAKAALEKVESELHEMEQSEEFQTRREEQLDRLSRTGRTPRWTLRYSPTKGYAQKIWGLEDRDLLTAMQSNYEWALEKGYKVPPLNKENLLFHLDALDPDFDWENGVLPPKLEDLQAVVDLREQADAMYSDAVQALDPGQHDDHDEDEDEHSAIEDDDANEA
ncbi:DEAD/DEAH box helicase family protein [Corynebacterium aquilae]|uniref:Helicase ATP-binding domain-containing protein n=1 Tax=Corynebacterium aquilae DSM 44791 TaxID=1431546 RepID=A0A1L7CEH9_9CORY|nr:DEAD/DEAH box helicase family protein [Corynebacterium aquilae]APT84249.1 hypothetical protein CAQU_03265 [Corynebacterium aquilae DSM 44791]